MVHVSSSVPRELGCSESVSDIEELHTCGVFSDMSLDIDQDKKKCVGMSEVHGQHLLMCFASSLLW